MEKYDCLETGREVFNKEIEALEKTRDSLGTIFEQIVEIITGCTGKVIITGIGKPGHIAKKMAATFASLGTPAFYLHPAEAMHGDLGMISSQDIVIAISYSGESDEIIRIIPNIKLIGATLVGITGNGQSTLAQHANIVQVFPEFSEACHMGLAPTSSTTAELCYGDALAIAASDIYGFKKKDFGKYHPAGSLGKKLIYKACDLMASGDDNACIGKNAMLKDAIVELSKKGLGIVNVIDDEGRLIGVITDGDLRRLLEKGVDVYRLNVIDAMNKKPITITGDKMAVDALNIMKEKNVSCLPIMKEDKNIGTIRIQTIINAGIIG